MRRLLVLIFIFCPVVPAYADHDGGYYDDGGRHYYEGGESGDQDGGDGSCRNFCNWTIPGDIGGGKDEDRR